MVIVRGEIRWADLGPAYGSRPANRRPVLIVSSDDYNASRLSTVLALAITSNTRLAAMPGNVFLPSTESGLPKDSVANVTALVTLDKADLGEPAASLGPALLAEVDRGLRRVLGL